MGPRPKDKVKSSMKSTKKQKRKKTSISDNTVYDTCDDGKVNVQNQTLQKNVGDDKASTGKNGKPEIKEEGKRRVKNEKSVATDKLKRKSVRVKAERNTPAQNAASRDEKEPSRRQSPAVEQDSEQSTLNNESENQDPQRSYEDGSPKTYRKNSPKNGGQRKSKIRSKSKSPSRDVNPPFRKAEITLHREAGNNNSPDSKRNNSPKQREQRNNRNESPDRQRHDGIERSRSPINFDSGVNDSHPRSKKASKMSRKRSPGSIAINKHRSRSIPRKVTSLNNDNQQMHSEDKGSSTSTRGRSPKPRHDGDTEQESTEKKPFAETSVKPDRSPPHPHKDINNERQKNSSQGRVECKAVRGKSPKLRLKTSHLRKDSSKTIKKSKTDGGSKSLPGFRSSGKKVLSGKNNKNVTGAEAKSKEKKGKLSKKIKKKLLKSTARKKS